MNRHNHITGSAGQWAFALILLVVGIGWTAVQIPLYAELATPWLRHESLNIGMIVRQGMTIFSEILTLAAIYFCLGTTARRVFAVVVLIMGLFTIANLAYLHYFGSIIHLRKIQELYTLLYIRDQLMAQIVNATMYLQLALSLVTGVALWVMADRPALRAPFGRFGKLCVLVPSLLLGLTLYVVQTFRFDTTATESRYVSGNSTTYYVFGMGPVYSSMVVEMLQAGENLEAVPPIHDSLNAGLERLPSPGLQPDAVFFIQAESLDASAVFHVSPTGNQLMPFLHALTGESILLRNFYHHHNGAASASAEIGALLGIIPMADHNGFLTINATNIHPLNAALEREGFTSFFLHSNKGSFLGRRDAYEKMGFTHFFDMASFTGEASGFRARDDAFFQQSLELIATNCPPGKKPFAYLVTMQTHGPFNNYRASTRDQLAREGFFDGPPTSELFRDYLASMRELDEALAAFWRDMTPGRYANPLVVLYPDHQSGVYDKAVDDVEIGMALIWSPTLPPRVITTPLSSYDLPTTVMHLLGVENAWPESGWWIGDTVLTSGPRKIILVHNIIMEGEGTNTTSRLATDDELTFIYFSRDVQE
jgi:phosphoglycerol transferase MdoB-like AlkP superfamily enzyme